MPRLRIIDYPATRMEKMMIDTHTQMNTATTTMHHKDTLTKRTFWAALAFYVLIAFEFFYMASPFAVYFYAVYRPGLEFLNSTPALAWLSQIFLPHIVIETASPIVNSHNVVGSILAISGFIAFCVGAAQVYYHKLTRKGAVTGGIYNIIRHPQYASFAVCSLGLLLLWPRYIVLAAFVTLLFAYYLLARLEERECEQKFGQPYLEYKSRTHMFLPFRLPGVDRLPAMPESGLQRCLAMFALYIAALGLSLGIAAALNVLSLNSLYSTYAGNSAYISISKITQPRIDQIVEIAVASPDVQARLNSFKDSAFLNYILPAEWHVSEIPMNPVDGNDGHHFPRNFNTDRFRVVFTSAVLRTTKPVSANKILMQTEKRIPVVEAVVDLAQQRVVEIRDPHITKYDDLPVPMY